MRRSTGVLLLACVFAVATNCLAQQQAPSDPRPMLFAAARADIAQISDPWLAQQELADLAQRELPSDPQAAATDLIATTKMGPGRFQPPVNFFVSGLARSHLEYALQVLREAQMQPYERARAYGRLVMQEGARPGIDRLALTRECIKTCGSFPIEAAQIELHDPGVSAAARREIVTDAYAALAELTDSRDVIQMLGFGGGGSMPDYSQAQIGTIAFLTTAHQLFPDLDPQLTGVLQSVIPCAANSGGGGVSSDLQISAASEFMALLKDVAPSSWSELAAAHPDWATPQPQSDRQPVRQQGLASMRGEAVAQVDAGLKQMKAVGCARDAARNGDAAGALQCVAATDAGGRFDALTDAAFDAVPSHSDVALQLAQTAVAMIGHDIPDIDTAAAQYAATPAAGDDAAVSSTILRDDARLAGVLARLGQGVQAQPILDRCIGAADRLATDALNDYTADSSAQPNVRAMRFYVKATQATELYASAAGGDFALIAAHAQALPAGPVRPLVLMSIAGAWQPPGEARP